jgi:hypothetical protein
VSGEAAVTVDEVRAALLRLFIDCGGAKLREEDEQKAVEVAALLGELARRRRDGVLVDAAAGKAPVGLLAAELLGFSRLVVIERDGDRAAACRLAAARLRSTASIDLREGDVGDPALWPERPDVAVALHACGPAADAVVDSAIRARARFLLLVPCCYGEKVPLAAAARGALEREGFPRQGPLRRRMENALVDAERTLRLEAGGYDVEIVEFVPASVTPHNLLWRCRFAGERTAMGRATAKRAALLERLCGGIAPGGACIPAPG